MFLEAVSGGGLDPNNLSEVQFKCLEKLLIAADECMHIVTFDRELIDAIKLNSNHFGRLANAAWNQPARFEIGAIKKALDLFVQVNLSETAPPYLCQSAMIFGPEHFAKSSQVQPVNVVGENITDVDFFEQIGIHYLRKRDLFKGYRLNLKKHLGGGQTTSKVFDTHRFDEGMCLCVVDTDKKHPLDEDKGTAKAFKPFLNKFPDGIDLQNKSRLVKIEAHESEALIPTSLIKEHYENEDFSLLNDLERSDGRTKLFLDHKVGGNCGQLKHLDSVCGEFWRPLIENIATGRNLNCGIECQENCSLLSTPKLDKKALKKLVTRISKKGFEEMESALEINTCLAAEWERIGKIFYSWCCAGRIQKRVS